MISTVHVAIRQATLFVSVQIVAYKTLGGACRSNVHVRGHDL